MIKIKVQGVWVTLDTLNGYYRLEDLWAAHGKPASFSPRNFMRSQGPHRAYSLQFRKYVWGSQSKLYQYAAWICPQFSDIMHEALEAGDAGIARQIVTGVIHK